MAKIRKLQKGTFLLGAILGGILYLFSHSGAALGLLAGTIVSVSIMQCKYYTPQKKKNDEYLLLNSQLCNFEAQLKNVRDVLEEMHKI